MNYTMHSRMLAELTPASSWQTRHQHIARIWRPASWLLAVIAYLGVLIAPTVTIAIPFQILIWLKIQPPSTFYWLTATVILLFALWLLYRIGCAGYQWFRKGVIFLDEIFLFVAVTLTVAFIIWIMPTGWIPTPLDHTLEPTAIGATSSVTR